jgi:DNA-binding transcriptional regulator YhcF (GntR family)
MQREAWRDLDCGARCAYVELASRYAGRESNNGRIPYSVREMAEALGTSKATALRALNRLQDHGFIVLMKKGAFSRKVRHASEWRLTEFPCNVTNEPATKDFVRWKKQNTVSSEHPNGFQHDTAQVSG